jgi:hypothetical protein
MRNGRVIDWATALETSPEELFRRLRGLWRDQEDLYVQQSRIRQQVHTGPDRELDEHLMKAEQHIAKASALLGAATFEASRLSF